MSESENFLDELLAEAELKEELQTEAYFDLLLMQIEQLQGQIAHNFEEAEKEIKIISDWALRKNHALQSRTEWLEKKLEAFIRERKVKTIDLAHGVLKFHKKQDKVEITDLDVFLKNAKSDMLSVIPEQVKPDLQKIKHYLKTHYKPIPGLTITPGKEEFTYKLKEKEEENAGEEKAGTATQSALLNRVAV